MVTIIHIAVIIFLSTITTNVQVVLTRHSTKVALWQQEHMHTWQRLIYSEHVKYHGAPNLMVIGTQLFMKLMCDELVYREEEGHKK